VAVLAGFLVGCDDEPERDELRPPERIEAGDHYVAIGDSYTGAPGTGPVDLEDGCVRSTTNYPHLVAAELGLQLSDVSCGGATTEALYSPQHTDAGVDRPPQLTALTGTTDLVTLSIGANDFNLYGTLVERCVTEASRTEPAPCNRLDLVGGESALDAIVEEMIDRLDRAIGEVRERAPDARILVVGYPQFVPLERTCTQLPITEADYDYARRLNEGLILMLEEAAARADVEYVDVAAASAGHDMCSADPWMAGVAPGPGATAYHPYPVAQRAVADLIKDLLAE
jgi:lysophospholipase L1-like esterase